MVISDPPTLPQPGESPLGYGDVWLDPATHLVYEAAMRADYGAALHAPGDLSTPASDTRRNGMILTVVYLTAVGTPVPITAPK
jgi:hypothetical protein